jgi:DNA (cytosine-5)-methyltransferase 1
VRYGSVCSGIEAASVAWHPLGWEPAWFAEIEAFPSAVLAQRWPGVLNVGDFTKIGEDAEPVELLVGGTPCQSFSVAGKRAGLDDPRGNLTLEFLALAGRLRPRWVVWENVPGVLSDDEGRTFGTVLGILEQLGYGWAYGTLDAQYFGVPQRRRRVFVVGCLGSRASAAAVLLEPSCLSWNPPPRRETGEGIAASLTRGADSGGKGGYAGRRREDDVNLALCLNAKGGAGRSDGEGETFIAAPLGAKRDGGWRGDLDNDTYVTHALRADGFDASEDGTGRGTPLTLAIRGRDDSHDLEWRQDGTANAILTPNGGRAGIGVGAVGFYPTEGRDFTAYHESSPAVKVGSGGKSGNPPGVHEPGMTVRRLTPRECERLQGFPDDYTLIDVKGKPAADGPRYRAIGNSMAVPVMAWIGRRIDFVNRLQATA